MRSDKKTLAPLSGQSKIPSIFCILTREVCQNPKYRNSDIPDFKSSSVSKAGFRPPSG